MNYKPFFLVVMFVLFLGVNKSNAQCECVGDITTAVEAVMATTGCDADGLWEAPHALEVHLKKLQNWCGKQEKPLKSKVPNIVAGMLETIEDAYAGEIYLEGTEFEVVVNIPAPICALDELEALETLLRDGCLPPPPPE